MKPQYVNLVEKLNEEEASQLSGDQQMLIFKGWLLARTSDDKNMFSIPVEEAMNLFMEDAVVAFGEEAFDAHQDKFFLAFRDYKKMVMPDSIDDVQDPEEEPDDLDVEEEALVEGDK